MDNAWNVIKEANLAERSDGRQSAGLDAAPADKDAGRQGGGPRFVRPIALFFAAVFLASLAIGCIGGEFLSSLVDAMSGPGQQQPSVSAGDGLSGGGAKDGPSGPSSVNANSSRVLIASMCGHSEVGQ